MQEKFMRVLITDQSKLEKYLSERGHEDKENGAERLEIDLQSLVLEFDDQLIQEGYQPFQRPLNVCSRIAKKLGLGFTIGQEEDDFVRAVHDVYERLYRKSDLYMPPMHIGTFAFKDIFLPLRVLVIYGRASVNPMQGMKDVPENVLKWVFHKDETAYALFDQWIDLVDFVYGLDDISKCQKHNAQAIEFWQLAKQQLEGAAATLLGSIDKYTVIQNSIIAIELLFKGALIANGSTEKEVAGFGHRMEDLANKACDLMPSSDHARLKMIAVRMPRLVERRYQMKDYKRIELGQIMMDAQYVAGEVLRQFSDRDTRSSFVGEAESGRNYSVRYYPPCVQKA